VRRWKFSNRCQTVPQSPELDGPCEACHHGCRGPAGVTLVRALPLFRGLTEQLRPHQFGPRHQTQIHRLSVEYPWLGCTVDNLRWLDKTDNRA
jgi:hypothetical protein